MVNHLHVLTIHVEHVPPINNSACKNYLVEDFVGVQTRNSVENKSSLYAYLYTLTSKSLVFANSAF